MDSWKEINWFAVQSKPHQENLAASVIGKMDVEVFLPKIRQEQSVCGVPRLLVKPLFPGYLFARFTPSLLLDAVRHALGVLRVLGTAQSPIPLAPQIIEAIRERVQPDGFIRLEPRPFRPGDKVSIERGPFAGWMGQVESECDDGRRVSILLEAVNQARLSIEKSALTVHQTV